MFTPEQQIWALAVKQPNAREYKTSYLHLFSGSSVLSSTFPLISFEKQFSSIYFLKVETTLLCHLSGTISQLKSCWENTQKGISEDLPILAMVAQTCDPSNFRGLIWEDCGFMSSLVFIVRYYLKPNQTNHSTNWTKNNNSKITGFQVREGLVYPAMH